MFQLFAVLALFAVNCSAGVVPAAYVAPYATSYNAHVVNHAVAAPLVAAAPAVAYSAPLVHAAAYSAYPYTAAAYSAPLVVGK